MSLNLLLSQRYYKCLIFNNNKKVNLNVRKIKIIIIMDFDVVFNRNASSGVNAGSTRK